MSMGQGDSTLIKENLYLSLNDPNFDNYNSESYQTTGLIKDLLFDGQQKTLDIAIDLSFKGWTMSGYEPRIEKMDVCLSNLTEPSYLFYKSYNIYNNVMGNPFAQPVQVYSNITNGFGIFAGSSSIRK